MKENKFPVGGFPATYVLIICCLLYMVNFMDRSIFAVVHLVDRWSSRKASGIMAIVWSVMTCFTGLGKSFMGVLIPVIGRNWKFYFRELAAGH